jgi:hypothetical protein
LGTVSVPSQDGLRTILVLGSGAALAALLIAAFLPWHVLGHATVHEPHTDDELFEPVAWQDPESRDGRRHPGRRGRVCPQVISGTGLKHFRRLLASARVTLVDPTGRHAAAAVSHDR